jgi:hypothetical protein
MACFGADSIPRHIISGAKTSAQILDLLQNRHFQLNAPPSILVRFKKGEELRNCYNNEIYLCYFQSTQLKFCGVPQSRRCDVTFWNLSQNRARIEFWQASRQQNFGVKIYTVVWRFWHPLHQQWVNGSRSPRLAPFVVAAIFCSPTNAVG